MAFTKIDEDAIMGDQPFDSFLLKGIHANIKEAYLTRPKRGAVSFAYDIRPQYGCLEERILPLAVFPLSDSAINVSVRVFCDILDDSVYLRPVLLSTDGRSIIWQEPLPIGESLPAYFEHEPGYDQFIDFDYDVRGISGLVVLGLSITSKIDETSKVSAGEYNTDFTNPYPGIFVFGTPLGDLDSDKRQIMRINYNGTNGSFVNEHTIIAFSTGKESCKVQPFAFFESNPNFLDDVTIDLELITIGSIKISGMCFKESFDTADLDFADTLDPGYRPSSSIIQNLIGLEKQFFNERTTIHHIGPSVFRNQLDNNSVTHSLYGTRTIANDNTWRNIGNDIFLAKDTDQIVYDSITTTRTNCAVAGIIDCGIDRNVLSNEEGRFYESLAFQIRTVNYTFDTGDEKWNADPETYEQSPVPPTRIKTGANDIIYLPYRTFVLGLYERSRFTDPLEGNSVSSPPNFSVFYHEWNDEYLERRRFQVQVSGNTTTVDNVNIVGYNCFAYIPTYTVWTTSGGI